MFYQRSFSIVFSKLLFLIFFSPAISIAESKIAPQNIPGATTVTAEQVFELILSKPGMVIIDSRKSTSFLKGHIQGTINIPDKQLSKAALGKLAGKKSTPLLFYCNGEKCMRSSRSVKKALSWGYTNIYWFRGGWKEWQKKNLPVEK